MSWKAPSPRGFSLIELMVVLGVASILMAFALPALSIGPRHRVNTAVSQVRDALQTARLRSVAVNRPLQVRLNCPAAGQFRVVEAGWSGGDRCSEQTYPYPAPADAATRVPAIPRYDGPVRILDSRVTLNAAEPALVLQFAPDGRVTKVVAGVPQPISSVQITVSANNYQRAINVNGLGKVNAQ